MPAAAAGTCVEPIGWGDTFGGRAYAVVDYTSTSLSYTGGAGNGEGPLDAKAFGMQSLYTVIGGGSTDGTLYAVAYPSGTGFCTYNLRFYVSTTGAELANAQNPSGIIFKITAIGV